jgi:hypothetical protein
MGLPFEVSIRTPLACGTNRITGHRQVVERLGVFQHPPRPVNKVRETSAGRRNLLPRAERDTTCLADRCPRVRWRERRFRVPDGVVLHYASVPNRDRAWAGPVPITSPRRTLADCSKERISPDLLREAAMQALRRGVVTRADLREVAVALEPFGGLAA